MKQIITTLLTLAFISFGIMLSLLALYASPDEKVYFLEASYIWIGNSIAVFGLLYYLKKSDIKES